MGDRKVVLLGLDGGTFDILQPWMDDGSLPNFKRIEQNGVTGNLESTLPATTPPAWTSSITGKNPGKHGVFDFRDSYFVDARRPLINSNSIRARKIWEILNGHGLKCGVVNLPVIYPPVELDGFMVAGMMTPGQDSDYTYPGDLKQRMLDGIGEYVVNIDIPQYDVEFYKDAVKFFEDLEHSFKKRADAFFWLWDNTEWDLFWMVFILPDRIGHLFAKYLQPGSKFYDLKHSEAIRGHIRDAYILLDGMVGKLLDRLEKSRETDLLVMSDHGLGPTHAWINANTILKEMGLLSLVESESWKKNLFMWAMKMNDHPAVKALIPDALQSFVRGRVRKTRGTLKDELESTIDWDNTKAFFASIACQGVYINTGTKGREATVTPEEYDELRERIKKTFEEITDPETGERIMDWVKYREELYEGDQVKYAPDIVFRAKEYAYLARQHFGHKGWLDTSENIANGFHRQNGIFMALGDRFKKGHKVEGANIPDITPTILHAFGLPVPDDMDGKVVEDAFSAEYMNSHPVSSEAAVDYTAATREDTYSEEEDEDIRERLKGLGYIE